MNEAVNQDFIRYDQVEKNHTYRLAESDSDEFDTDYRIQTFDLGRYLNGNKKDRKLFAEEFGAAVQDIGFSVLTGHGVDKSLYDEMNDRTEELYTTTSTRPAAAHHRAELSDIFSLPCRVAFS